MCAFSGKRKKVWPYLLMALCITATTYVLDGQQRGNEIFPAQLALLINSNTTEGTELDIKSIASRKNNIQKEQPWKKAFSIMMGIPSFSSMETLLWQNKG